MNKYDTYKQELIERVVRRQIDAFGLIDIIIELRKKTDRLDEKLNNKNKENLYGTGNGVC